MQQQPKNPEQDTPKTTSSYPENKWMQQTSVDAAMIQNLPGGYYCCSAEEGYPFLYMSDRFLHILGWTAEEIRTQFQNQFSNLLHPDDLPLLSTYIERISLSAKGQNYLEQIYRLRGKDGYRWVLDSSMQMQLHDERFFQCFITDITTFIAERDEQNAELERLRAQQVNLLENQLDTERQYMDVISRKYILVYHADLKTNQAKVLKLNAHSNADKMSDMYPGAHFHYLSFIHRFAENYIVKNKQHFLDMLHPDYITQQLQTVPRYSFRYEGVPNPVGNHHYEIQVIRVNDLAFDGNVLITAEEIDPLVHAEERRQAELNAERKYLDSLCWDYTAVYRVNLKNNTSIPLKVEKNTFVADLPQFQLRKEFPFVKYLKFYSNKFVAPKDRERFQQSLLPDNLCKELQTLPRFVFRYHSIPTPAGYIHFEAQAIRLTEHPEEDDILLAFRHIDDVIAVELRYQEKLNIERQYLDVLSRDFTSVYHVNLDDNTATPLKQGENTNASLLNLKLRQTFSYSQNMLSYCENYICKSSQLGFLLFMARDNLRKSLRKMERYVYRYRCIPDPKGHEHFEVAAIRLKDDPTDGNILIAFRYIDDAVTAEQRLRYELEERLEQEQQQNEILAALGRNYHAIFQLNLIEDTHEAISCQEEIRPYYPDIPSAQELLKNLCDKIVDTKYSARMHQFFDLSTLAQRLQNQEFVEAECITKDGVWLRQRLIAKHRNPAGTVIHALYVTQIINDEKQYQEHLIAKAEYANLANQSKTSFISQVAHDIRTPMNSIFGFLEIAEANLDNPENLEKVRYSLGKIHAAGEFLKNLVNDVLDISRMEDGKVTLQPEEVSLTQMLEDIKTSISVAADEKNQTFRMEIHDIRHDHIVTDLLRIMQIYSNVLSNAVKYTPNDGIIIFTLHQEEITERHAVRLCAKITDTGIGMSEEFMQNMFGKFERGTDTRINKVSGYGLGLTIVKQLVDLMGGTIDVQSQLGEGTTFCIDLEMPYVDHAAVAVVQPEVDYAALCRGMHLLVAEDNELNREVITELLAMHEITCDCAEDGAVCLERFRHAAEGTYDAVLMDMQMPIMDGIAATRNLRALPLPWAKTIPIIAMTANALKDDVKKCLDAGMNQHLSKPVDMAAMLKTLSETTGKA